MRSTLVLCLAALLSACGSAPQKGGYYKDDGPHASPPSHLDSVPDAEPRPEPLHRYANRPYRVFGRDYVPFASLRTFRERGMASWYGRRFHGKPTASGESYDMYAMSAAHPTLPIPSYARVTHLDNGRSVVVRINDRGPFHAGRVIDLSYAAAHRLGIIAAGSAPVEVESIVPGEAPQAEAVYVQLGVFSSRENAESLRARIARELDSMQASVQLFVAGSLWRLQLGPYRSHDEARPVAERVESLLDLKPLLVVR